MKAPRYSAVPEGSVPLRLKPTFAKANRTSAKANTSMISSVRRLLRPPGTSGLSGSTAGVGAVMLLTSVPWPRSPTRLGSRGDGTGRDAERLRCRARGPGLGRLLAGLGDLVRRFLVLLGQGHSAWYLFSCVTQACSAMYACLQLLTALPTVATMFLASARLLAVSVAFSVCW